MPKAPTGLALGLEAKNAPTPGLIPLDLLSYGISDIVYNILF